MDTAAAVLFVCHANLCRSPMAERLMLRALAERSAILPIASAGTHAHPGLPMHWGAVLALREAGADSSGFRSRPVSGALLNGAGLVLTATREQRAYCVALAPSTLRRTFTLRQFGRLAAAVEPGRVTGPDPGYRLASLVGETAWSRGQPQPAEDDLADPVDGTEEDMRICVRQIQSSMRPVLAHIMGP